MYTIYISDIGSTSSIKCPIIAAVRTENLTAEPELPAEFVEYADVFDTEKTGVL
jgi:hypothetical protein